MYTLDGSGQHPVRRSVLGTIGSRIGVPIGGLKVQTMRTQDDERSGPEELTYCGKPSIGRPDARTVVEQGDFPNIHHKKVRCAMTSKERQKRKTKDEEIKR